MSGATPSSGRPLYRRALNITVRTAHIGVTGVLVGGHVFAIAPERLKGWLLWAILTGGLLAAMEALPHGRWLYQGRGLFVLAKLALLCLIPWFWESRVTILVAVLVLASVGSHMPARFRYYSVLHGRVLSDQHEAPRART